MADGKIYITISDRRGGSGAGVSSDADTESSKKETSVGKYVQHRFFNFMEGQAKRFVSYSVGNIGNFTGNYQAQRDIEVTVGALSFAINLASAAYTGAKAGGWVGAVVALTTATLSEGANIGYREYSEWFQNKKDNHNIDMMRKRLGLEGLTDGSRTGGY